jgi:hypothetical protein
MGTSLAFHLTFAISGVGPADDPCIRRGMAQAQRRIVDPGDLQDGLRGLDRVTARGA